MNLISNPPRGCGRKKEGGFYLAGESGGITGDLNLCTYWYGDGGVNAVFAPIKDRGQVGGAPVSSLVNRAYTAVLADEMLVNHEYAFLWPKVHSMFNDPSADVGLFDYIGKGHYPVWTDFTNEGIHYGFSRRVTEQTARIYNQLTPFPLLFVYKMPVFTAVQLDTIRTRWADLELGMSPTWSNGAWDCNATADGDDGSNHFLNFFGTALSNKQHSEYDFAREMYGRVRQLEKKVIASTWVTHVAYAAKKDDTDDRLMELAGQGFAVGELSEGEKHELQP